MTRRLQTAGSRMTAASGANRNGKPVKGWLSDDQKWYWLVKATGMMFAGGWKQIDGKWYYFYTDGTMAVNTTIDGYTIGSDGERK